MIENDRKNIYQFTDVDSFMKLDQAITAFDAYIECIEIMHTFKEKYGDYPGEMAVCEGSLSIMNTEAAETAYIGPNATCEMTWEIRSYQSPDEMHADILSDEALADYREMPVYALSGLPEATAILDGVIDESLGQNHL